jgi:hypothetical protein
MQVGNCIYINSNVVVVEEVMRFMPVAPVGLPHSNVNVDLELEGYTIPRYFPTGVLV